jgi:hypothetical protein
MAPRLNRLRLFPCSTEPEAWLLASHALVVDTKLLKAADASAKREKMNRSALVRRALERHLTELDNLDLEARDRAGYLAKPQLPYEYLIFQEATAWPED